MEYLVNFLFYVEILFSRKIDIEMTCVLILLGIRFDVSTSVFFSPFCERNKNY